MIGRKEIEKELVEAYNKAIDSDIESFLAEIDTKPVDFSVRFEKRMAKLLGIVKNAEKENSRFRTKRIIFIAVAAVIVLLAIACAFPQVRKSIAGFFIEHFGDHVEYSNPDVIKASIEEEYGLVPIPAGFEEIIAARAEKVIITEYYDNRGTILKLQQVADDNFSQVSDSEHGEFMILSIEGKNVQLHYSDMFAQAVWIENGYCFSLECLSSIDFEQFKELIGSVRIK